MDSTNSNPSNDVNYDKFKEFFDKIDIISSSLNFKIDITDCYLFVRRFQCTGPIEFGSYQSYDSLCDMEFLNKIYEAGDSLSSYLHKTYKEGNDYYCNFFPTIKLGDQYEPIEVRIFEDEDQDEDEIEEITLHQDNQKPMLIILDIYPNTEQIDKIKEELSNFVNFSYYEISLVLNCGFTDFKGFAKKGDLYMKQYSDSFFKTISIYSLAELSFNNLIFVNEAGQVIWNNLVGSAFDLEVFIESVKKNLSKFTISYEKRRFASKMKHYWDITKERNTLLNKNSKLII